jgi:putative hydrolase of the HAD superfamily
MIPIFDLDDTLYDEMTFVQSGFAAVAKHGYKKYGLNSSNSLQTINAILETNGRGAIFDKWLKINNINTKKAVEDCVHVYRHHTPKIKPYPMAVEILKWLSKNRRIYLVTDGHKIVQHNKIEALKISKYFEKIYITHRYGINHAKPSLYCFEQIRQRESCRWQDLMYIGDNPKKDFVNLNKQGSLTVRLLLGHYSDVKALPGYEAQVNLDDLSKLDSFLTNQNQI